MACIRCKQPIHSQSEIDQTMLTSDTLSQIENYWNNWCGECQKHFIQFVQYPPWAKHRFVKVNTKHLFVKYVGMSEAYFRLTQ